MAWNQSRIKLYRRCQKAYAFRYDTSGDSRELVPRVPKIQLKRGTWLHALQEAHHRQLAGEKNQIEAVIQQMAAEYDKLFDEEKEEYRGLPEEVVRIFQTYLRCWQETDPDRYKVAKLKDGSPAVEFVIEVPLDRWRIEEPFKGRIDLMLEDLEYGGLWLRDAKWVKSIPPSDERMMSPQALMYAWAMRKLGYDIRGFIYDYGCTKSPTRPTLLRRSSQYGAAGTLTQKPSLSCDYWTYLETIKEVHPHDWKYYARHVYADKLRELKLKSPLWFRRERIPVEPSRIKTALGEYITTIRQIERRPMKVVPRTYDYRCKFGCDYHDLCVTEFNGMDIEPLIKAKFTYEEERYGEGLEGPDV